MNELRTDFAILAVHLVLVALGLMGLFFFDVAAIDFALGFVLGIGLYSLFWRWRYGFWPD